MSVRARRKRVRIGSASSGSTAQFDLRREVRFVASTLARLGRKTSLDAMVSLARLEFRREFPIPHTHYILPT